MFQLQQQFAQCLKIIPIYQQLQIFLQPLTISLLSKLNNNLSLYYNKKKEHQMAFYYTPVKANTNQFKYNLTHDKPTDWICNICHNLNFSFRKKCNRCKTQTRIDNQNQISVYNDYFYQPNNATAMKQPFYDITNCQTPDREISNSNKSSLSNFSVSNKKVKQMQPSEEVYCRIGVFDNEYWEQINMQLIKNNENYQQCLGKQKRMEDIKSTNQEQSEESEVNFQMDEEIENLVNKIFDQDD